MSLSFNLSVYSKRKVKCVLSRTAAWSGCYMRVNYWRRRTSITLTVRLSTTTSRRRYRFSAVHWTKFHRCRSGFPSAGSTSVGQLDQPLSVDHYCGSTRPTIISVGQLDQPLSIDYHCGSTWPTLECIIVWVTRLNCGVERAWID